MKSCHTYTLGAFLQEASLVDDQHAAFLVYEMLEHVPPEANASGLGVPVRGVQKALGTLRVDLARGLSELPAVLAIYSSEQADEVALCSKTSLRTSKTSSELLKSLRPSTNSIQLIRDFVLRDHLASLRGYSWTACLMP